MAAIETNPVAAVTEPGHLTLDQFLAQQKEIDLLRFITCGSVDDEPAASPMQFSENRERRAPGGRPEPRVGAPW